MDYLTKWPEVFPAKDQSAYTIAKHLVENIITRHGVPRELLSDRGAAFLSGLMKEVYRLMGIHKANTTAYHPQTDGRVWDERVSFVLFAYRASPQQSTGESPFFQMYGRDPVLPTPAVLNPPPVRCAIHLDDYKIHVVHKMSEAWDIARKKLEKSQQQQKEQQRSSSQLERESL